MKIFLIGFMGSGKSTVAGHLSKEINLPYIEMDQQIEEREGMKISAMFEQFGEKYFREMETKFLETLKEDAIISTGGGVVVKTENISHLKKGFVVFLDVSWEEICSRLENDTDRPLWRGEDSEKKKRYEIRLPLYKSAADTIIHADTKTPQQIAREIAGRLKQEHRGHTNHKE
ncbi:shikimate kinase [Halobacillus rhizosphaerae]|uniref:shikimate kinase n=1 Tax=Halobacillus rhizosphaerae TaxID=3064889 RepID=UPI00398A88E4